MSPESIHLTAKFIGEVPDSDVDEVARTVADVAVEVEPFDMEITGIGCFPERGPVRIVWIGVREESGALVECVERLEEALWQLGFPKERRRYTPHLTIGRVRWDESDGAIRKAVDGSRVRTTTQPVSGLTLMMSALSPKGPTYTPVNKTKFGQVK